MASWVYKCNARGVNGPESGDWEYVFTKSVPVAWGPTDIIPALNRLRPGDRLLCYQTDRNELIGIARVVKFRRARGNRRVVVQADRRIGAKIRPLKEQDRRIGRMSALQGGPIATIYEISESDANHLIRAADRLATGEGVRAVDRAVEASEESLEANLDEAQGFSSNPKERRAIERYAVRRAKAWYRGKGYEVAEKGKPYDLHCTRAGRVLLVEVKGTRSAGVTILLTKNEVELAHTKTMELFIMHSIEVSGSGSSVRARGGVMRVEVPWQPDRRRLKPIAFQYLLGPEVTAP